MSIKNTINITSDFLELSSYSTSNKISEIVGGIDGFQNIISQCANSAIVGISLKEGGSMPVTTRIDNLSKTMQKLTFEWFLGNISTVLSIYLSDNKFIVRKKSSPIIADSGNLDTRLTSVENAVEVLNGTEEGSVNKQISDSKISILGEVSEDFNTLEKIERKVIDLDTISSNLTGISVGDIIL